MHIRRRTSLLVALAVPALAVALAGPAPASPVGRAEPHTAAADTRRVVDQVGYFAPRLDNGTLTLGVQSTDYAGQDLDQWNSADDVVIHLVAPSDGTPGNSETLPAGVDYDAAHKSFIGLPGAQVWTTWNTLDDANPAAAEAQRKHGLALGWTSRWLDGRGVSTGYDVDTAPNLSLRGLRGPAGGTAFLYRASGDQGAVPTGWQYVYFDAKRTDGLPQREAFPVPQTSATSGAASARTADRWTFTRAGYYCLDLATSVLLKDGTTKSDRRGIAFAVGDVDPHAAPRCGSPASDRSNAAPHAVHQVTADAPNDAAPSGGSSNAASAQQQRSAKSGSAAASASPRAAASPAAAGTCGVTVSSGSSVVDDGHFDYGVELAGTKLTPAIKDDRHEPGTWRNPASLLFRVDDTAKLAVPADPAYHFLGATGAPVWVIPQTQKTGVPWLGWNTQHPSVLGTLSGSGVTWHLDKVDGPGQLYLFANSSFGGVGTKFLGSGAGWPRSYTIPFDSHVHGNWGFTEPGAYRVTTTHTATPKSTGRAVSATSTLTFLVGACADQGARTGPTSTAPPVVAAPPTSHAGRSGPGQDGSAARAANNTPAQCRPAQVTSQQRAHVEVAPSGHFDFGSRVIGGSLAAAVKDGREEPATWRDTAGLVFDVGKASTQQVPAGYSFLGSAGSTVWVIPQTQIDNVPWLGWNTQDPSVINGTTGPVTFSISKLTGPGKLAVYTTGSFGGVEEKVFGTAAGFPRSFVVQPNVHAHANWAFTAPGVYRLTMTQTATLRGGKQSASSATLAFSVGRSDPQAAAPMITTTRTVGHTSTGTACTLAAGGTAYTGADVRSGLLLGLSVIALGGLAVALGRRRRRSGAS